MQSRICDICMVRDKHKRLAASHKRWLHGIRIDVCKMHEFELFKIKDWSSWQADCWLNQMGAPMLGVNNQPPMSSRNQLVNNEIIDIEIMERQTPVKASQNRLEFDPTYLNELPDYTQNQKQVPAKLLHNDENDDLNNIMRLVNSERKQLQN